MTHQGESSGISVTIFFKYIHVVFSLQIFNDFNDYVCPTANKCNHAGGEINLINNVMQKHFLCFT